MVGATPPTVDFLLATTYSLFAVPYCLFPIAGTSRGPLKTGDPRYPEAKLLRSRKRSRHYRLSSLLPSTFCRCLHLVHFPLFS